MQRTVDRLHAVHLEVAPPAVDGAWELEVGGEVEYECAIALSDLALLGARRRAIDFHCIWGWSRRRADWQGVDFERLLELVQPTNRARYAMLRAFDSPYASCVPVEDLCAGILAFGLDGEPLPEEHGGPLRWVQPHYMYGYKGVKWLASVTLQYEFTPGFWEEAVGDPAGYVPDGTLAMFEKPHLFEIGDAA